MGYLNSEQRQTFVQFSNDTVIFPKNLRWLHNHLQYLDSVRLTPCYCTNCIRHPKYHAFALRAAGRMPRGRSGRMVRFEYVTPYASRAVFDSLERHRLERWAEIKDETDGK